LEERLKNIPDIYSIFLGIPDTVSCLQQKRHWNLDLVPNTERGTPQVGCHAHARLNRGSS